MCVDMGYKIVRCNHSDNIYGEKAYKILGKDTKKFLEKEKQR